MITKFAQVIVIAMIAAMASFAIFFNVVAPTFFPELAIIDYSEESRPSSEIGSVREIDNVFYFFNGVDWIRWGKKPIGTTPQRPPESPEGTYRCNGPIHFDYEGAIMCLTGEYDPSALRFGEESLTDCVGHVCEHGHLHYEDHKCLAKPFSCNRPIHGPNPEKGYRVDTLAQVRIWDGSRWLVLNKD